MRDGNDLHGFADGFSSSVYERAFADAAQRLADAGENAGPESDVEVWSSWLAFEKAAPRKWLEARAKRHGWDR